MRLLFVFTAVPVLAVSGLAYAAAPAMTPSAPHATAPAIHHVQAMSTIVIAPSAPPPLRVESVPPAPAVDMVWQPGHWNWTGADWQWMAGAYVAQPRAQVAWVPGHWEENAGQGWIWVDGYWQ